MRFDENSELLNTNHRRPSMPITPKIVGLTEEECRAVMRMCGHAKSHISEIISMSDSKSDLIEHLMTDMDTYTKIYDKIYSNLKVEE